MISRRFLLNTSLLLVMLISQFAVPRTRDLVSASSDPLNVVSAAATPVFDFAKEVCTARWVSGAGQLPCPATDGDVRGFAASVDSPKLENGNTDSAPGLLVSPQNKYDGYIQGFFPEYTVQPGDHFQASVGCAYGSSCYVTYRLDYQINNGVIKILWSWKEKNEGKIYQLDKDLSALAGKKVSFILTLLATGSAANDRALWGQPRIMNAGSSIPTSIPGTPVPTSATPPVTVPPTTGTLLDFAASPCSASWRSGVGALPCPGTDGDTRGFVLSVNSPKLENGVTDNANALVLFPQSKYDGYIQGTFPEIAIQAGDRFQGIVNCAYGASCYVTFRLDYQIGNGPVNIFWSWKEKNEGLYYRVDKDLSALAGKKIKFTLTILATGSAMGDRALWSQPRIVRTTSTPPTLLPIYDFNTFGVIGAMGCSEVTTYTWRQEACNGESGGCWISQTPLFGNSYAGFFRHDGNTICGLNIP